MTIGIAPIVDRPVGRFHVHAHDDTGSDWIAVAPTLEMAVELADEAARAMLRGTNLVVLSSIGTIAYRTTGHAREGVPVVESRYVPSVGATGPETMFGIGYTDMPRIDGDRWSMALAQSRIARASLWRRRTMLPDWTAPWRPIGYVLGHPDVAPSSKPIGDSEFVAAWQDERDQGCPSAPWDPEGDR